MKLINFNHKVHKALIVCYFLCYAAKNKMDKGHEVKAATFAWRLALCSL